MITYRLLKKIAALLIAWSLGAMAHAALTDISTDPLNTYSAPSSSDVKPNVLYVLDDSGSMSWDFMPDWACAAQSTVDPSCGSIGQSPSSPKYEYLFRNAAYNGIAYNPAVTYQPPIGVTSAGVLDTTKYPSMTGTSTTTGGDSSATSSSPDWKSVHDDFTGVQSSSTTNVQSDYTKPPYFFTTVAGEYCTSPSFTNCITATAPSGSYTYPAKLKWCTSSALTSCRAAFDDAATTWVRSPSPSLATVTFSSVSSASVTGITVNGNQIMAGSASSSSSSSTLATNVITQINQCTISATGNCTTYGYHAYTLSSGVVTIIAPSAMSYTPTVTKSGVTATVTAFSTNGIPGTVIPTVITSSINSYPYPGSSTKASTRTDCAGTTCTYKEEMTNYANWWTYYRTRMQMMKTAASIAFASIDSTTDMNNGVSRFRVGYMSINDNTGHDFLNLGEFAGTQKYNWYSKFFAANPGNSTPLRAALSKAGRLYGGKLNGTTLNGSTVTDPLQYSCQQNYTILSTDGFWNESSGYYKLDGSTTVGNQDGPLARPYYDGASNQAQQKTSTLQSQSITYQPQISTSQLQQQTTQLQVSSSSLQKQTSQLQSSTSQLQKQTSQLQKSTSSLQQSTLQLQQRTSSNSGSTWSSWSNVSSCTWDTNGSSRAQCQYAGSWSSWSNVSSCTTVAQGTNTSNGTTWSTAVQCQYTGWTAAANVTSCTAAAQSAGPSYTVGTAVACSYVVSTPYANASSCTATTTPNGSGQTTQCQYTGWTAPANATSCTAAAQSAGPSYTVGTAVACSYVVSTPYANASSCTATTTPNGSGQTTQCQYTGWSSWTGASSCTAVNQSSGPSYAVGTATKCQSVITTPYTNASSCTATTVPDGGGNTTQCQYAGWSAWSNTSACTPVAQSTGPNYTVGTAQQCQTMTVLGTWTPASSCTTSSSQNCQYTAWSSSWSNVSSCTAAAQSTGPTYTVATARQCQTLTSGGTSNTLADVAAYYYNTDLRSSTATGADATGTCTGPVISPSTTANDLCADNVPSSGRDVATTQHMTTFTLGLGSQGQMIYAPNDGKDYWNDTSGDFYDVRNGSAANSSTGICSWMSNGSACNWPTPSSNSEANIDDLWHAAVNGHGTYFSAKDPSSLATGLASTLSTIVNTPRAGTAAAAATSNPNVSASDNYVFSSSYKSVDWYGELIRQQISETGTLTAQNWSAMRLLDCTTTPWTASHSYTAGDVYRYGSQCYLVIFDYTSGASYDSSNTGLDLSNTAILHADENATVKTPVAAQSTRTIYTKGSTGLMSFDWSTLQTAGMTSYFTAPNITYTSSTSGLTQFCSSGGSCLSSSAQSNTTVATGGAAGEALVNFLRGDRTNEGTLYRKRTHVLGDIVSSEGRYVQTPLFDYTDANYGAFKTLMTSRTGAVYVGGNDGMVHAFSAITGQEMWAYVPSMVLPNMYKLADTNYSTKHQFFVDGTPETGDICPNAPASTCSSSQWKTILVGGLNRGGKGYYALDVTNPSSPQLLWEFTNTNLGYSYSNPKIGKLNDGTWVVIVASGYNNADGAGHLFVLNANTGALIRDISTGVGTASSPSGLARISTHVMDPDTDNTIVAVYGGDTFGNLWRFDVNNNIGASGYDAQLLVSFKDPVSGGAQPITVKPLEATINGYPVVFVGTGIYLGTTDVSSTQKESFYAVLDRLNTTTYGDPHTTGSGFVQQTLTSGTCPAGTPTTVCTPGQVVRTSSNNAVDWSSKNGWYIDFPTAGERSVTDPSLGLGTLLFTTITPQASSVSACGGNGTDSSASFFYALDYLTGGSVNGANNIGGASLGSGLATRPVLIELANGTLVALVRTSGQSSGSKNSNTDTITAGGTDVGSTSVSPSDNTDLGNPNVQFPNTSAGGGGTVQRMSWRELPSSN